MAIDVKGHMVAGLVGVADEALEWWDSKSGRNKPFRTATDLGRLAITVGALAAQQFRLLPKYDAELDTASKVGLALTIKSISRATVRKSAAQAQAFERVYSPRSAAGPIPPIPAMAGGYRSM